MANGVALAILAKLSAGTPEDARALLAAHDDWHRLFETTPPDATAVNAWWTQLAASNPGALDALVLGASVIVGSLGGVPPANRVAANAINAKNRIPGIEAQIRRLQDAGRGGEVASVRAERLAAIDRLEKQLDYLRRAANGDVQLYLYEPDSQNIIEMIGTLEEETTDVITYVPGTYTSVHSFYGNEVQQVGRWLNDNDPDLVTFVWKEGLFPGDGASAGGMNPLRIFEANDETAALDKGVLIANFQQELIAASPQAASADLDGMGHSWGLAGIASSEVAGARYTQVLSLSLSLEQGCRQDGPRKAGPTISTGATRMAWGSFSGQASCGAETSRRATPRSTRTYTVGKATWISTFLACRAQTPQYSRHNPHLPSP